MKTNDPLDIETLPQGRDLDALIARLVMNLEPREIAQGEWGAYENGLWFILPHYSTQMSAAWQVVQRMRSHSFKFDLFASSTGQIQKPWSAATFLSPEKEHSARAETPEMAICRAALKAMYRKPQ